jgi:hypothetical protein
MLASLTWWAPADARRGNGTRRRRRRRPIFNLPIPSNFYHHDQPQRWAAVRSQVFFSLPIPSAPFPGLYRRFKGAYSICKGACLAQWKRKNSPTPLFSFSFFSAIFFTLLFPLFLPFATQRQHTHTHTHTHKVTEENNQHNDARRAELPSEFLLLFQQRSNIHSQSVSLKAATALDSLVSHFTFTLSNVYPGAQLRWRKELGAASTFFFSFLTCARLLFLSQLNPFFLLTPFLLHLLLFFLAPCKFPPPPPKKGGKWPVTRERKSSASHGGDTSHSHGNIGGVNFSSINCFPVKITDTKKGRAQFFGVPTPEKSISKMISVRTTKLRRAKRKKEKKWVE